jgi:hypothetical protein
VAIQIGGHPTLRLTLNGIEFDHVNHGLIGCNSSLSDDEANRAELVFAHPDAVRKLWSHRAKLKLEYGWNGQVFDESWQGTLETVEPTFAAQEQVRLTFYGPSFALRNSNKPEAIKGSRVDIAKRIITGAGLKADLHISASTVGLSGLKDASTKWDALKIIARASNAVILEKNADTIYIGSDDGQKYDLTFHYKTVPKELRGLISPSVVSFEPRWTTKNRLAKVTVISTGSKRLERFEGTWNPKLKDNDPRTEELEIFVAGLQSRGDCEARAKHIGTRGEGYSRQANLSTWQTPVRNGDIITVAGDVGPYSGSHYVRNVARDHMVGGMSLGLEWRG